MIGSRVVMVWWCVCALACGEETSSSDGIQVALSLMAPEAHASFTSAEDNHLTFTQAHLGISSVALEACPEHALWRALRPISAARAHGTNSPVVLAVPHVINLLGGKRSSLVGSFTPAPGDFCGVRVHFDPVDEDAAGAQDAPQMVGRTFHMEGTTDRSALVLDAVSGPSLLVPLQGVPNGRLTMGAGHLAATIQLAIPGLDVLEGHPMGDGQTLLRALAATMVAQVQP